MDLNLGSAFPVLETKTLSSPFLLLIWTLGADLQLNTLAVSFVFIRCGNSVERASARCFPRCQFLLVRLGGGEWAGQRFPWWLWIPGYSWPTYVGPLLGHVIFLLLGGNRLCTKPPLRWEEMKGDETAGLVLSHSGQIFCSHRAALIVIKPAVVYLKTCHKRDIITEGASTVI